MILTERAVEWLAAILVAMMLGCFAGGIIYAATERAGRGQR